MTMILALSAKNDNVGLRILDQQYVKLSLPFLCSPSCSVNCRKFTRAERVRKHDMADRGSDSCDTDEFGSAESDSDVRKEDENTVRVY